MEEKMERVFLSEIRRAARYKREGKYPMALSVLSAARGSLEKTLKMSGDCSKRDVALYVYLFISCQDALCRTKRRAEADAMYDEVLDFFDELKQEEPAMLGRCYLSVMRFHHVTAHARLRREAMDELEKTCDLLDGAACRDVLDDSVMWGQFFARAAAYAQRHELLDNDRVNQLFDKALLYLQVYTPEKGVKTHACRYEVQRKICWGKVKCYMKRRDWRRGAKMLVLMLQAWWLEAAYSFAAMLGKKLRNHR